MMCGFENYGFIDHTWLKRYSSTLLLRALVVGKRQQSKSIGVAPDME